MAVALPVSNTIGMADPPLPAADVDNPPTVFNMATAATNIEITKQPTEATAADNVTKPLQDSDPSKQPKESAVARTWAITELREAILLELPETDLLLAQRINKTFKNTIAGSKKIQRKLFFDFEEVDAGKITEAPKLNPFLEKMFPPGTWEDHEGNHISRNIIRECRQDPPAYVHLPIVTDYEQTKFDAAQQDPDATWRRMWATSPSLPVHPVFASNHAATVDSTKMGDLMAHLCHPDTYKQAAEYSVDDYFKSDLEYLHDYLSEDDDYIDYLGGSDSE